jgi:hypothetical protein
MTAPTCQHRRVRGNRSASGITAMWVTTGPVKAGGPLRHARMYGGWLTIVQRWHTPPAGRT